MFDSLLLMEFCWFSSSSFVGESLDRLFRHNKIVTAIIIANKGIPTPRHTINSNWVVVNSSVNMSPFWCSVTLTLLFGFNVSGLFVGFDVVSCCVVSELAVDVSCGCPGRYWQFLPLNPVGHAQEYSSTLWVHFPPFLHGEDAHSSISIVQNFPVNPGLHVHSKSFTRSLQAPPFAHGLNWQSSTLSSHSSPTNPGTQRHTNSFTPSRQVPPLRHGLWMQSSSFTSQ